MDSISSLAKATRFSSLGMASGVGLVIAGYLALAGSAFFAFDRGPDTSIASAEETAQVAPALVCECHYDTASPCAAN